MEYNSVAKDLCRGICNHGWQHCMLSQLPCLINWLNESIDDTSLTGTVVLTFETASHVFYDSEALATLRYQHLGQLFLNAGDFDNVSIIRILHFVRSAGLLSAWAKGLHKILKMLNMHRSLRCPTLFILFYSEMRFVQLFRVLMR